MSMANKLMGVGMYMDGITEKIYKVGYWIKNLFGKKIKLNKSDFIYQRKKKLKSFSKNQLISKMVAYELIFANIKKEFKIKDLSKYNTCQDNSK